MLTCMISGSKACRPAPRLVPVLLDRGPLLRGWCPFGTAERDSVRSTLHVSVTREWCEYGVRKEVRLEEVMSTSGPGLDILPKLLGS